MKRYLSCDPFNRDFNTAGDLVSFGMLLLFFKSEPCPEYLSLVFSIPVQKAFFNMILFYQPLCVLVNSDAAVSVALSVFLVGRCCHMKRMYVVA